MADLNNELECSPSLWPMGFTAYDDPARYGIELPVSDIPIYLPHELAFFSLYRYNPAKRRISFRVAKGTAFRKQFSGFPGLICSNDPMIQGFKDLLFSANPSLDRNSLTYYTFMDLEGPEEYVLKSAALLIKGTLKIVSSVSQAAYDISKISDFITWAGIGFGLWQLYDIYKKRK